MHSGVASGCKPDENRSSQKRKALTSTNLFWRFSCKTDLNYVFNGENTNKENKK